MTSSLSRGIYRRIASPLYAAASVAILLPGQTSFLETGRTVGGRLSDGESTQFAVACALSSWRAAKDSIAESQALATLAVLQAKGGQRNKVFDKGWDQSSYWGGFTIHGKWR